MAENIIERMDKIKVVIKRTSPLWNFCEITSSLKSIAFIVKSNPNEKGAVSFVNYDLKVDPINIQFEQLSYTIKENGKRQIK